MPGVISIMVVDDQPVVREALRRLLDQQEDMQVVGVSGEVLAQVEKLAPDIVLIDVRMPEGGGIELTRQIKQKFPSVKVIMLSFYGEYLSEAIEAGADGFLLKDIKLKELSRAIRYVELGEVVISGRLLSPLLPKSQL